MKQNEAVKILERLLVTVQKLRSNEREAIDRYPGAEETKLRVLTDLQPWIWGDKCLLPPLEIALAPDHDLTPGELYNFMFVVNNWAPELNVLNALHGEPAFPQPSIQWLRGWD